MCCDAFFNKPDNGFNLQYYHNCITVKHSGKYCVRNHCLQQIMFYVQTIIGKLYSEFLFTDSNETLGALPTTISFSLHK